MSEKISSKFINSVAVLLSGTILAQLLNVIFIPLITRLYTPEELGELGFYMRIVVFFAALVTLRLELGLMTENNRNHRLILLKFTVRLTVILSILLFIPILVYLIGFSKMNIGSGLLLLIPLGIIVHALYNIGTHLELANENYRQIAGARFVQSASVNIMKVGFGLLSYGPLGLVISVITGISISLLLYLKGMLQIFNRNLPAAFSKRSRIVLKRHSDLYKYNLPHVIVDLFRDLVLASLILFLFSEADFGYFDLSFKILKIPVAFLGAAVGQVLFSKLVKRIHNKVPIQKWVLRIAGLLLLIGVLPFTLVFFFGPEIFTFISGPEWKQSGVLSGVMTWWLLLNFIVSPLAYLPVALDRQKSFFFLNLIGTIAMVLSVYIPVRLTGTHDFITVISIVSVVQVFYNLIVLTYFVAISAIHDRKLND